jgi:hypothetical protein
MTEPVFIYSTAFTSGQYAGGYMQQRVKGQQVTSKTGSLSQSYQGTYRFFIDSGHGWLEVPQSEVVASGAKISAYSYYDPVTGMAYLEEDCDAPAFLRATGKDRKGSSIGETVESSAPRRLPRYGAEAFIDSQIFVVRPGGPGKVA